MAATSTPAATQLGSTSSGPCASRRTPSKATAPESRNRKAVCDEGGERLDLAVAVLVLLVGRLVGGADRKPGDGRRGDVEEAVGGVRDQGEGARREAGRALGERDPGARRDGRAPPRGTSCAPRSAKSALHESHAEPPPHRPTEARSPQSRNCGSPALSLRPDRTLDRACRSVRQQERAFMEYLHTMVRVTRPRPVPRLLLQQARPRGDPPDGEREGPLHPRLPRRAGRRRAGAGDEGAARRAHLQLGPEKPMPAGATSATSPTASTTSTRPAAG